MPHDAGTDLRSIATSMRRIANLMERAADPTPPVVVKPWAPTFDPNDVKVVARYVADNVAPASTLHVTAVRILGSWSE